MMRRQKKNGGIKLPDMIEDMRENFLRYATVALVATLFIGMAVLLVKAFLYRSDYFRIRAIETRAFFLDQRAATALNNQILGLYRGRNVFSIPLDSIARSIRSNYADVKDLEVRIALPDKLAVTLKLRRPVAIVHNVKYYPIDEDGVVLPPVVSNDLMKDLPVIEGIDVKSGRRAGSKNLKLALNLLSKIRQSRPIAPYGISSINAADPKGMSFYLKNGIEIRVGAENLDERLEALAKTLKDPRLVVDKIKYIDVRFEDVAIGPK